MLAASAGDGSEIFGRATLAKCDGSVNNVQIERYLVACCKLVKLKVSFFLHG